MRRETVARPSPVDEVRAARVGGAGGRRVGGVDGAADQRQVLLAHVGLADGSTAGESVGEGGSQGCHGNKISLQTI